MSRNRQVQWRPERKPVAGKGRLLALVGMFALLVCLLALIIWYVIPRPVPGVAFVVATDPKSSSAAQATQLYTLLSQLQKENVGVLSVPEKVTTRENVLSVVKNTPSNKSLVIYLAATVETRMTGAGQESEHPSLRLTLGESQLALSELFKEISSRKQCTTLVLLDLVPVESGLSTGTLANDIADELRFEIDELKKSLSGVSVIAAFDRGERNWEYFSQPVGAENNSTTQDPEVADSSKATYPRFEGTAFGHFIIDAVRTGQLKNVNGCFEFLTGEVGRWVSANYAATQTVTLWPSGKQLDTVLLDQVLSDRGLAAILIGGKEKATSPVSNDGADSEKSAKVSATETAGPLPQAEETPETRIQKLLMNSDSLRASSLTRRYQDQWQRFQSFLLTAEKQLLMGQVGPCRENLDAAEQVLEELVQKQKESTSVPIDDNIKKAMRWLDVNIPAPNEAPPPEVQQPTIDELSQKETLPVELTTNEGLALLSRSIVGELERLRNSGLSNDEIRDKIVKIRELVRNLPAKGLALERLPSPLGVVYEILAESPVVIDFDHLAAEQLNRLLSLHRQACFFCIGYDAGNQLITDRAWREFQIEGKIAGILKDLLAAQQWLKLAGERGADQAKILLDDVEGALGQLDKSLELENQRQQIITRQRMDSHWIIQYFAHLQEQSTPAKEEIDNLKVWMAAISQDEQSPPPLLGSTTGSDFRREELLSMWRLTADLSVQTEAGSWQTSAESCRDSLESLEELLNRRVLDGPRARQRWWWMEIPLSLRFMKSEERIAVFRGLQTSSHAIDKPFSETGIWMGFWSIRLLESLGHKKLENERSLWREFADAVAADAGEPQSRETIKCRARLGSELQQRWKEILEGPETDDFSSPVNSSTIRDVLSSDLALRRQVSKEQSLYTAISNILKQQDINGQNRHVDELPANDTIEFDGSGRGHLNLEGMISDNAGTLWISAAGVQIGTLQDFERELGSWRQFRNGVAELAISLQPAAGQPKDVLLVVCDDGIPRSVRFCGLQTFSETEWKLEASYVKEEGKPDESPVNLTDGRFPDGKSGWLLDLPPSLTDDKTALNIKFTLRRTKGSVSKVEVEVFARNPQGGADDSISGKMPLQIPEGQDFVGIPLNVAAPVVAATAVDAAAAASSGTASDVSIDITRGLILKVSWGDSVTESVDFGIIPRLLDAEKIFDRPKAEFDPETGELLISIVRSSANFDGKEFLPLGLPVEVLLNKVLSDLLEENTPLDSTVNEIAPSPFKLRFRDAENSKDPREFGVSAAGIPHAWWWQIVGDRVDPVPASGKDLDLRIFLEPQGQEAPQLAKPLLSRLPPMTDGFDKLTLKPTVYLYGQPDLLKSGDLELKLLTQPTNDPTLRTPVRPDLQISAPVNGRFLQKVSATAGKDNVWKIRTSTQPFTTRAFSPAELGVRSGRHKIIASLSRGPGDRDPQEKFAEFLLDESPPALILDGIPDEVQTNKLSKQKFTIRAEDKESGVLRISVGIEKSESPPTEIYVSDDPNESHAVQEPEFSLQELIGFPVDRPDDANPASVTLLISATNGAGKSVERKQQIRLKWPPLPKPVEPNAPGSITVILKGTAEYTIRIDGPKPGVQNGKGTVTFAELPPGKYNVSWEPLIGTLGDGFEEIEVESGKPSVVPKDSGK